MATRFEEEFYKPFYEMVCEGAIEPCWPGHLAEGVIATARGEYVFLQNTTDAVVWFKNAELAPYATAIYKKEGSALKCVYNQLAFTWKPV